MQRCRSLRLTTFSSTVHGTCNKTAVKMTEKVSDNNTRNFINIYGILFGFWYFLQEVLSTIAVYTIMRRFLLLSQHHVQVQVQVIGNGDEISLFL